MELIRIMVGVLTQFFFNREVEFGNSSALTLILAAGLLKQFELRDEKMFCVASRWELFLSDGSNCLRSVSGFYSSVKTAIIPESSPTEILVSSRDHATLVRLLSKPILTFGCFRLRPVTGSQIASKPSRPAEANKFP